MCGLQNTLVRAIQLLGMGMAVRWTSSALPMQGAQVRSLARELRSHMLKSVAKNKIIELVTEKTSETGRRKVTHLSHKWPSRDFNLSESSSCFYRCQ